MLDDTEKEILERQQAKRNLFSVQPSFTTFQKNRFFFFVPAENR